jgi:vacuolar iron transporter family protein
MSAKAPPEGSERNAGIRPPWFRSLTPVYLRDFVYGGIDGAVTTFAIVSGVVGADLESRVILILGLANLVADGFSMAAGNYSGTKTELDDLRRIQQTVSGWVENKTDSAREAVRQIMAGKGLNGEALAQATDAITSDKRQWVALLVQEERGSPGSGRSPVKAAATTFAAFVFCGSIPLMPFLLGLPSPFVLSMIATAAGFALIGAMKSYWSLMPVWLSAVETLAIGSAAAFVAYFAGDLLARLV